MKKEITKLGKSLQGSLPALEKRYMMPEGLKGIQSNPGLLSSTLWQTSGYIEASDGAPNQTARIMMEKARKDVANIVSDINRLFQENFAAYQQKVEVVQFSLFKAFEPIKME